MRTVHEVSELTGVSVRALHYYDRIGLLRATETTPAGYRMYDDAALERLQLILLFKELEFSLREIGQILDRPDFDRSKALRQQICLLELRRERLGELISLARGIQKTGVGTMQFDAFDRSKLEEYTARAKAAWGGTDAYGEYERKSRDRTEAEQQTLNEEMMDIFRKFGALRTGSPQSPPAAALVKELRSFITEHYYRCTDEILRSLGQMYAAGGEFTANIDAAGGEGTAAFVQKAIEAAVTE